MPHPDGLVPDPFEPGEPDAAPPPPPDELLLSWLFRTDGGLASIYADRGSVCGRPWGRWCPSCGAGETLTGEKTCGGPWSVVFARGE